MNKHSMIIPLAGLLMIGSLSGCILRRYGFLDSLYMEPRVITLDGLNTPYDDFNVSPPPPPLYMDALLVFASNADSAGARFQIDAGRLTILQKPFHHYRDKKPARPRVQTERLGRFPAIPDLPHNVRGPTALFDMRKVRRMDEPPTLLPDGSRAAGKSRIRQAPGGHELIDYLPPPEHAEKFAYGFNVDREPLVWADDERMADVVWMFDTDQDGQRNLYFQDAAGAVQPFFGNDPEADDAYATYDYERHVLYFSSNRDGQFDIYRYRNTSGNTDLASWLGDRSLASQVERVEAFSAEGDTMAPFVEGDTLLFASDRPGGEGGFDLYISAYGENDWEPPVNLQRLMPRGVRVNTAANEFRPCLLNLTLTRMLDRPELNQDWRVLVFSSDRPGGQGGYDLYLTALPE